MDLGSDDSLFRDACGIFAMAAQNRIIWIDLLRALASLNHRGHESAGMFLTDGKNNFLFRGMGWASQVFDAKGMDCDCAIFSDFSEDLCQNRFALSPFSEFIKAVQKHQIFMGLGHVRYSTSGTSSLCNAQPFMVFVPNVGWIGVSHNGNLVDTEEIREKIIKNGYQFISDSDSEIIAALIAQSSKSALEEKIIDACYQIKGAFSLAIISSDKLIALRDRHGIRPLCYGGYGPGECLAVSSESCALEVLRIPFIQEIRPGEILVFNHNTSPSLRLWCKKEEVSPKTCIFEGIYYRRPDSFIDSLKKEVELVRLAFGEALFQDFPLQKDLVIGIPDSGTPGALGFSRASKTPYARGFIKNQYVARTFIDPQKESRKSAVDIKLNPLPGILSGKRVVVVDDSIVRGNTARNRVFTLHEAGAEEVNILITSPQIKFPCFYGIDTATKEQLIASDKNVEQVREFIGADFLGHLSLCAVAAAHGLPEENFCTACFSGKYPIPCQKLKDLGL